MNTIVRWLTPITLLLLSACGSTPRAGMMLTDINEPEPGGCKVNIHVVPSKKFVYVDQEPVHISRCSGSERKVLFQVNGPYKFMGSGISAKAGGTGAVPRCEPEGASGKRVACTFAAAPVDPNVPDRFPYFITIERNGGGGSLKLDPMIIND